VVSKAAHFFNEFAGMNSQQKSTGLRNYEPDFKAEILKIRAVDAAEFW
jgi:hypothetical protein